MTKRINQLFLVLLICFLCFVAFKRYGPSPSWHQRYGWKAQNYFEDPLIIQLCHAIEFNDVSEINRLVAAGANVNALGKDNMTPLLWAYPDNKIDRVQRLLELGANPNICYTSDFNTNGKLSYVGGSVTHLVTNYWSGELGHFDAVFKNGGDPNLTSCFGVMKGYTPLFTAICSLNSINRYQVERLIELGADIDLCINGETPVIAAVTHASQYGLALKLLKMGADPKLYPSDENNMRLIHHVVLSGLRYTTGKEIWPSDQEAAYNALVDWLEANGEFVTEAKQDLLRWNSWNRLTGEYELNIRNEVKVRKALHAK